MEDYIESRDTLIEELESVIQELVEQVKKDEVATALKNTESAGVKVEDLLNAELQSDD